MYNSRLVALVIVFMLFLGLTTASAEPSPLERYRELASQGEKLNESLLEAQDDLISKQTELNKIHIDLVAAQQNLTNAKAEKSNKQIEVDHFAAQALSTGVPGSKFAALLTASSSKDFLYASSVLDRVAEYKNKKLESLDKVTADLHYMESLQDNLQSKAQSAKDKATILIEDIKKHKQDLDSQIQQLLLASNKLSSADRAQQRYIGVSEIPTVIAPGPAAQVAVNAALSRLGSPYIWGATGPNTFDCSGLMQWAYARAGINLPRVAAAQAQYGSLVASASLQPGDLVFFYSPVSHVGMYIGGGKMINAPTAGEVVKIASVGSVVSARRVT